MGDLSVGRRAFLKVAVATGAALAVGPQKWGWAVEGSPFGALQDDPLLLLPEGFSYKVLCETGVVMQYGTAWPRPSFPGLNVVVPHPGGKVLLSASHEVPSTVRSPGPPPSESYDRRAGGAITSLLLNPDM